GDQRARTPGRRRPVVVTIDKRTCQGPRPLGRSVVERLERFGDLIVAFGGRRPRPPRLLGENTPQVLSGGSGSDQVSPCFNARFTAPGPGRRPSPCRLAIAPRPFPDVVGVFLP